MESFEVVTIVTTVFTRTIEASSQQEAEELGKVDYLDGELVKETITTVVVK